MALLGELGRKSKTRSSADSGVVGHFLEREDGGCEGLKNPGGLPSTRVEGGFELLAGSLPEMGVVVLAARVELARGTSDTRDTIDLFPRVRRHGART